MESVYERDYKYCPNCKTELVRSEIDRQQRLNCKNCGFIFWSNPKPVVSAIVEKDGKILMLKRAVEPFKGYWVLPGGFIDYEETPEEATVREVKEETGLEFNLTGLVDVYRIDDDPTGVHIDIIYSGTSTGETKMNDNETAELSYFSVQDLPEQVAYEHERVIKKWNQLK